MQQNQYWCGIWPTGSMHIDVTCDMPSHLIQGYRLVRGKW